MNNKETYPILENFQVLSMKLKTENIRICRLYSHLLIQSKVRTTGPFRTGSFSGYGVGTLPRLCKSNIKSDSEKHVTFIENLCD